jgi:hypothetical protein
MAAGTLLTRPTGGPLAGIHATTACDEASSASAATTQQTMDLLMILGVAAVPSQWRRYELQGRAASGTPPRTTASYLILLSYPLRCDVVRSGPNTAARHCLSLD